MKIIAHRGYAEDNIENTVSAFKKSVKDSDMIELDIRSSLDNIPVVFHDEKLDRLCKYNVDISKIHSDNLNSCKILGSNQSIPKLSQVLNMIDKPILVEIKDKSILEKTIALCDASNNKVIYQSFNPEIIREIPDKYETFLLCTPQKFINKEGVSDNAITTIEDAIDFSNKHNVNGLSIHHSMIEDDLDINYDIYVWTIRSKEIFDKISTYDINGVISDSKLYVK